MLLYFYDKKEIISNKDYVDNKNNIYIEYPYFNDITIDSSIQHYLNSLIEDYIFLGDYLFVDYDYVEESSQIDLMMYVYEKRGNVVEQDVSRFEIDRGTSKISVDYHVVESGIEYDGYSGKLIDKEKPMVALTFDDGPNHNTIKILNILEHYGVKATFFILGTNIEGHEEIIKKMDKLGMEIGNHMYSHKLITKLTNEKIKAEVEKVDNLIFNIIGKYPTLVRPSYGTYNKRIRSLMNKPIIIWNVDTLDWKHHSSKRILAKVMKNVSDGDIILMHDIYSATANGLELVIPKLLEQGYQLVTVSELLYYKEIELKAGNVYSHAD